MAYESQKLGFVKNAKHKKIVISLKIFSRNFHGRYFVKINRQENHRHKKAPIKGLHGVAKFQIFLAFSLSIRASKVSALFFFIRSSRKAE